MPNPKMGTVTLDVETAVSNVAIYIIIQIIYDEDGDVLNNNKKSNEKGMLLSDWGFAPGGAKGGIFSSMDDGGLAVAPPRRRSPDPCQILRVAAQRVSCIGKSATGGQPTDPSKGAGHVTTLSGYDANAGGGWAYGSGSLQPCVKLGRLPWNHGSVQRVPMVCRPHPFTPPHANSWTS